ncbi:MAG TPA: sigma-70 family RNA polymerase sigma factor [Thermoleophilaceae bacterium]|jgi:RNA polymerase sigma factor (sigma-70 family)
MPLPPDIDSLVARAQRGDAAALEAVCARARPLLVRHARRLLGRSADAEDAVQEVLILTCARIGTYRWEGSFAGWLYAIATRSILRRAARTPRDAALAAELADRALVSDYEPMTEAEWRLVEQDVHMACTVGVLTELSPETRRLYLLGEVLAVPDRVGAEVARTTPAAYRKRLERARRAVAAAVRAHAQPSEDDGRVAAAARELDDLLRLGELHRAHARPGTPAGALRALERVAPTLAS